MTQILELKNVKYTIDDKNILEDINISVDAHEFIIIKGPSGSGKSTVLKMMGSLISPTSGTMNYNGHDIESFDLPQYRRDVAYCFQTPVLFGKTVRDNLTFPYSIRHQDFDEKRAISLLQDVGLEGFLDANIHDISGGERQRVALVRSLMFPPKVLLLDEITSALDKENRDIIWSWILKIKEDYQITIISVTHQDDILDTKTRDIIVEKGRIV